MGSEGVDRGGVVEHRQRVLPGEQLDLLVQLLLGNLGVLERRPRHGLRVGVRHLLEQLRPDGVLRDRQVVDRCRLRCTRATEGSRREHRRDDDRAGEGDQPCRFMRSASPSRRPRACDLPCRLLPRRFSRDEHMSRLETGRPSRGQQVSAVPRDVLERFSGTSTRRRPGCQGRGSERFDREPTVALGWADMARQTIREVAERASVSLGTVSNVLNKPELSPRRRASASLPRSTSSASSATTPRGSCVASESKAIALIVLDFDNPFFTEVARGVEHAAAQAGHLVILASSGTAASREDRHSACSRNSESPASSCPPRRAARRRGCARSDRGTPIVLLDRHRKRRDQCSVAINDTSGGRQVAEHLRRARPQADRAHQRVTTFSSPAPSAARPVRGSRGAAASRCSAHETRNGAR